MPALLPHVYVVESNSALVDCFASCFSRAEITHLRRVLYIDVMRSLEDGKSIWG